MEQKESNKITVLYWRQAIKTYWPGVAMLAALFGGLALYSSITSLKGPTDTIYAKVTDIYMDATDMYSLPSQIARVILNNGKAIDLAVPSHSYAHKGDIVKIEVYRYTLNKSEDYKIVQVEHKQ